jgi:hypothetical protein
VLKRKGELARACPAWLRRNITQPAGQSGIPEEALLWLSGIAIGGITVLSAVFSVLAFTFAPDLADAAALAAFVVTTAALLLAVIAAAVGVLAYAVSTGSPDLAISVRFPFSAVNWPVFKAQKLDDGRLGSENFKQLIGEIHLRNDSPYSARSPAVIVRLTGIGVLNGVRSEGWAAIEFANMVGVTAFQWDGGSEHPIHGNSQRRLPNFNLFGLKTYGDQRPALPIEILADGYRKVLTIPVGFTVDDEVVIPGQKRPGRRRLALATPPGSGGNQLVAPPSLLARVPMAGEIILDQVLSSSMSLIGVRASSGYADPQIPDLASRTMLTDPVLGGNAECEPRITAIHWAR